MRLMVVRYAKKRYLAQQWKDNKNRVTTKLKSTSLKEERDRAKP